MSSKKYLKNHTCVESLMINNTEKKNILNLDKIDEILIKPKEKEKIIVSKESIPNLDSYIFRGIPCFLRNKLYSEFMDDYKLEVEYKYENKEISTYEHQIDVDIQRTFRNHSLFRQKYGPGQCRLFRVLISFADYMPEIGYCQGMSSIAGVLLMYFDEKDAFVMLVKLIKKNKLEGLFDKTFSKLDVILQIQDKLIQTNLPEIHTHLKKENISYTIYATSWYLTLFSRFRLELCLRIWDLFMYYDISILFYVVIAILKYFKNEILNFRNEDLIEFLSKIEKYEINTEKLFKILEQILIKVDLNVVRLELGLDPKN